VHHLSHSYKPAHARRYEDGGHDRRHHEGADPSRTRWHGEPVEDFDWSDQRLVGYYQTTADGPEGQLVMMFHMAGAWTTTWERHPLGAAVVVAAAGSVLDEEDRCE
jgi:hypothetical protein